LADDKKREDLKHEADDLKQRIEELRRKTDMPINPALGSPRIDAENADGRRDVKDEKDEEED
jgi:hypothetical protein